MTAPVVARLTGAPGDRLDALVAESEQQGLRFVRRLADEWDSGANRFDQPGEDTAEVGPQEVAVAEHVVARAVVGRAGVDAAREEGSFPCATVARSF